MGIKLPEPSLPSVHIRTGFSSGRTVVVPPKRVCHNCGSPNIQVLRDNKRELLITCSRCHCDKWFLRGYRSPKLDE